MRIDHVVYAVRDLDDAAQRLADEHGLASVAGGRHPWGTGNRIVPFGHDYLELLAVVDPDLAKQNPIGVAIAAAVAEGDRLVSWAVATDDIDAAAARAGLQVVSGTRSRAEGEML